MRIYNSRVVFTQVVFERDKQEGFYFPVSRPLYVPVESVTHFTNGEITLDDGNVILVEEDAEQIKAILDGKLKEWEFYQAEQRQFQAMGHTPEEEAT